MAMTDEEKASLAKAMGEENFDVQVGVDGKVSDAGQQSEQKDVSGEHEGQGQGSDSSGSGGGQEQPASDQNRTEEVNQQSEQQKIPYDQLEEEHKQLVEFAQNVYEYTTTEGEDRIWDIKKIVEDQGYDPSSLRKLGEKMTESTDNNNSESAQPQSEGPDLSADRFASDPQGFLKDLKNQVKQEALQEVESKIKPIETDWRAQKAAEMVNVVKTKYPDFASHEKKIADLVRRFQPKSAEDLEQLYFAAKAQNSAGPSDEPRGTNATTTGGGGHGSERAATDDDKIWESIQSAGAKPADEKSLTALFGKPTIKPFGT